MAQKKKDFTQAAAAAFDTAGDIVGRILAPQPATHEADTEKPTAGKPTGYNPLPKKRYNYVNKFEDEVRVTFMLTIENSEKLRSICYAERCKQKHVINDALQMYFDAYEAQHGKLV